MSERARILAKKPEAKKETSVSRMRKTDLSRSMNSPAERILFLQRTIGNQAVQRLIKSGALQTKLKVGQSGDVYEREADRVVDVVVRMPEPQIKRQPIEEEEKEQIQTKPIIEQITPIVQRQIEDEEEELQQKTASDRTPEGQPDIESHIHSLKGGGQPLSENDRAFFERRFGYNLGQVRVHTDAKASESAEAVNAQAYTVGQNIVFRAGQYAPNTTTGSQLLAHEMVHVLQQRTSAPEMLSGMTVNSPTGAYEIEADRQAGHILDEPSVNSVLQTRHTLLQRTVTASPGREPNPFQQNARVCLVHLHADEQNALEAARVARNDFCGNLLYVDNSSGNRCVSVVGLRRQRGRTCTADPNRIFSSDSDFTRQNAFERPCRCPDDLITEAIHELHSFATNFMTAIDDCRRGQHGNLPVVAFHNNLNFSIPAYQSGESDAWATASVGEIRDLARAGGLTARLSALESRLPGGLSNPIVQSQSRPRGMSEEDWTRHPGFARNFFVTTDIEDFLSIAEAEKLNVVLQTRRNIGAPTGRDDGSLSVALRGDRYINIEVAEKQQNADIVAFNRQMATVALTRLGISQSPCAVQQAPVHPSRPPHIMMHTRQSVPDVRLQLSDTGMQCTTYPGNLRTEVQQRRYSSYQFTTTAEQEWAEPIRPKLACNQLIQRRILIGTDQHPMTGEERDSIFVAGYCDPLIIQADYEAASRIVEDMERSSEELIFQDLDELRAEVARRILSRQGVLPREMTEEESINWLDENNITYTILPPGAVRFRNAITVDFSQVVSGFNLHDGRERVENIHPVTPRLAVALVRLIRHLSGDGVTILHHSGVSEGTHLEIGYAIDIRGFTFNDGTTILLQPAWNDNTTKVPTGETAQQYMRRIGQWMADNVFGQVLGPGHPNHENHFHAQVPFGQEYRGFVCEGCEED